MNIKSQFINNFLYSGINNTDFSAKDKFRFTIINIVFLLAVIFSPVIGLLHLNQFYGYDSLLHATNCFIFSFFNIALILGLRHSPSRLKIVSYLLVISIFIIFTSNLILSVNESVRILWFIILLPVADFLGDKKLRNLTIIAIIIILSIYIGVPGLMVNLSPSDVISSLLILMIWGIILHFYRFNIDTLQVNVIESEHRYLSLLDSSPDWIWEIDANGVFTYASPKVYEMMGYTPDEIIGKTPFILMSPDEAERIKVIYNELSSKKSAVNNLENIHLHKNGQPVTIEVNAAPNINEKGELLGYRGINRDITQRKKDELEIRAQQDFTDTILNAAGNVIVVLDLNGYFVRFNPAAEKLTGYEAKEVLGKPIWELVIPEEQQDGVRGVFENLTTGNIEIAGQYENEWLTRDGKRRLLHWHNSVLHNDEGVISHVVSLGYDITEIRKNEIEQIRMQNELQQAQKMESLGQLTGGIAHDFNNLLGIINGYATLLHDKYIGMGDKKFTSYVNNIKEAGDRAASLVAQMLSFSRSEPSDDVPLHLAPLLKTDLEMLRSTLPSTIRIDSVIEPDLPKVSMNPTHLHQILMNLSINARDAMNGVGQLTFKLGWARDLDTVSQNSHKPIKGDWIQLSISDTGSGINDKIIENIFNPFFTTKEVGKGTGLGLSVIYRIMEDHSGHILLETKPGVGSTFSMLFLPVLEEQSQISNSDQTSVKVREGNNAEILVVDDESALGMFMSEMLGSHGYRPTYVTDSSEAFELFQSNPDRFAIVITDQTMPKMTGSELIKKIRGVRADLPTILCSGYSETINAKEAGKLNISYLEKPVEINELLLKISELISNK